MGLTGKGTGMVLGTKTCIRILTWDTLTHRVYPYPWPSLYDCQKCQSVGDECRAKWSAGVSEHDGAWSVMEKNAEQWWTWPQLVCCALALKNLVSINFRLRKYYGELRSSVDQNMEQWDQNMEQWDQNMEQQDQNAEQRICVLFQFQTGVLPWGKLI